ncbi:HAMP domain-containing histidine kinase [Candidatus Dojkabacteria bacterium]|nr:HAMP domain-containing histidine kinase [Candidatus Dojkabacteria bacterium]
MKFKRFINTIKFKLILWISLLLIISTAGTFYFVNSSISTYYNAVPVGQKFIRPNIIDDDIVQTITDDRNALQDKVFLDSLIAVLVQIIICGVGSYLLIKQMIDPLEEVNKMLREINEKMLYKRVDIDGQSDEMNELIYSFNGMMGRLNIAFTGQKQFVENVSHEIKTPLTIIKTNLESISYQKDISKEETTEAIKTSINSIKFLNNLVDNLLLLSFLNNQKIKNSKLNIVNTVKETVKDLESIALNRKISIEQKLEKNKDVNIVANDILIKRSISNILENAIKYSNEGNKVVIKLETSMNLVSISITNYENVISDENKNKIFERFFRADKSRSRVTGGSGLGLSIAREIIEMYSGEIKLETDENSNTFIISLPISKS